MCGAGAGEGMQAGASIGTAYSQYEQGKMQQGYYNYLGDKVSQQATEVDRATEEKLSLINAEASRDTAKIKEIGRQTTATQRAAMAANGVYSDSGTFTDIIEDSIDKQALDEAAVKFNADLAMWQTKRESINQKVELYSQETSYRLQGVNAKSAATSQATQSLIGGAAQAGAGYYKQYDSTGKKPGGKK